MIPSLIKTHGWLLGVALIGGGLLHQNVGKAAAFSKSAGSSPSPTSRGPFVIIAEALGGGRPGK